MRLETKQPDHDVVVVGGGPAGLSAAMWLARYQLRVRLIDAADPRNAATQAIHGYLGLDDPAPAELREIGRRQAEKAGASVERAEVAEVTGACDAFTLRLADGRSLTSRRVLFATGLLDIIPEIEGLHDFYGTSIWHCPDCDGPEARGRRIGVIGTQRQIAAFCMEMLTWTDQITLFTDGRDAELPGASLEALQRFNIPIETRPIRRIEGEGGQVRQIAFEDGDALPVEAIFFHIGYGPASPLPASLDCEASEDGTLLVDDDFETNVAGVFATGDITHGSKLAIRGAADGARAAIGVYRSLLPKDRRV